MKALPPPRPLSNAKLKLIRGQMTIAHNNHEGVLLRRALYKTSDGEVSQDLVQTTFLKTLLYLQKGGKIDLMRSFLNHVLNDLIIDEYRQRKKKIISLDVLMKDGFEPEVNSLERNIDILDGEKIIMLIPQLSAKYELVIRLRYLKGLSLKEMSLITKQSENTVAVQIHRGLAKLKEIYLADLSI